MQDRYVKYAAAAAGISSILTRVLTDTILIELDDFGVHLDRHAYLPVATGVFIAVWAGILGLFLYFHLRRLHKRDQKRQQGFDVLPPTK